MDTRDMAYTNSDEEYHEICDYLDVLSTRDPFMYWESGRMNFWRHGVHGNKEPHDHFFSDNVHVWRAEDHTIVGLFISEYGKNDFFIEVQPEFHGLYPDIFRWIDTHWANTRTEIEIDVFSGNTKKIHRLEALGFQFKCHYENLRTYDLEHIDLAYSLDDGFLIQAFSESPDYESRVALVQSAFENPTYAESNLKGLISSPDYIGEYNLSVISPEKKHVAYCIGWHECAKEHAGYIEPVGTHAAYRRRGFAKAVIKECFARMKAHGIRFVDIASRAEPAIANYLYDSLHPQAKKEVHKYAKTVS